MAPWSKPQLARGSRFRRRMTESRELHPVFPLNAAAGINVRRHAMAQRHRPSGSEPSSWRQSCLVHEHPVWPRIGPWAQDKNDLMASELCREPANSSLVCHSRLRCLPCLPGLAPPSTHPPQPGLEIRSKSLPQFPGLALPLTHPARTRAWRSERQREDRICSGSSPFRRQEC